MTDLVFRIPGTPLAFARAGSNGKRRFTPRPQLNYMNLVKVTGSKAMKRAKLLPFDGPLYVSLNIQYPMPKTTEAKIRKGKLAHSHKTSRPDLDNLSKIVLDALNEIVWTDDAIIVSMNLQKGFTIGEGYTDIQVSRM